jgi:glycosyltransferase involved in cell wall biosynthesis
VGSNSGEIPNVMGEAGLLFAEGDADALRGHLQRLLDDSGLRANLGQTGRARVLAHYTMQHIAAQTVDVYHALKDSSRNPALNHALPTGASLRGS